VHVELEVLVKGAESKLLNVVAESVFECELVVDVFVKIYSDGHWRHIYTPTSLISRRDLHG
jgi:hypothetical protein